MPIKWEDDEPPAAPPSKATGISWAEPAPAPPPPDDTHTTAGGIAASVGRGLAPYAAGAGIGAGLGATFGGVGVIPGAVAGAGAVGLTDLAGALYNPIADATGLPKIPPARELTDKALDALGVKKPATAIEREAEAAAAGGAGGLTGARLAKDLAETAAPGVTKKILAALAKSPEKQAVSGAAGGSAAQGAAEAGGGPEVQAVAGLVGGAMPYAGEGLRATVASTPRPAALEARHAGYVLPPSSVSEKPGLVSSVLAGWGGKIKTQQAASAHNQQITNTLAAESLGLPKDTVLTAQVFDDVRQKAGAYYKAVVDAVPTVMPDESFKDAVKDLGGQNSQAAKYFPKITNNAGIKELVDELGKADAHPTAAWVEVVKELRHSANANLRGIAMADPSKHALGLAQREAANTIDELIERNVVAQTGQHGVVDAYRQARRMIAMAYDTESVTNPSTGDVNARGLAKLADKGRPLTGGLRTISDAAMAFPKAFQDPAGFGHNEPWSALDFFGSGAALAHGNPLLGAATLTRPLGRGIVLSGPVQNAMAGGKGAGLPLPLLTNPGGRAAVPVPENQ